MNKIQIILFFLLFEMCFSQTHRFIYELNYKKDSTESIITKEIYHLDINPDESYYYARDYFVLDSIMKNKGSMNFDHNPNLSNINFHKKNSNSYTTYEMGEYEMYRFDSNDFQNWKLINETKKIDNFTVQKAETNWGGRKWTAWFSTEIPFSEGPYKFHGLPGLIMELSDSKDNFAFKVVKSENYDKTLQTKDYFDFIIAQSIPLTEEKYIKLKLSQYKDPLSFLKMQNEKFQFTDDNWVMLKDGTKVTKTNQKEVIKQQQKNIKKYNNPIELDKAIKYPSN